MLIVVNAIFSMFSFCKLLYLNMFRRGAREAVRGVSCFPTDRADLHRCRSGRANPADRAQARQMPQMPFGRCLFSHRSRRFAQMPFGCFLFSHRSRRFAQMPVRGVLFSTQIAPLAPRSKREFCYNVTCYMLQ